MQAFVQFFLLLRIMGRSYGLMKYERIYFCIISVFFTRTIKKTDQQVGFFEKLCSGSDYFLVSATAKAPRG